MYQCFKIPRGSVLLERYPCTDPMQIGPQIETTLWTSPPTAGSISSSNYTWNDLMLRPIDGVGIENPATNTERRRITRQLSSRDLQQSFNPFTDILFRCGKWIPQICWTTKSEVFFCSSYSGQCKVKEQKTQIFTWHRSEPGSLCLWDMSGRHGPWISALVIELVVEAEK